VDNYAVDWCEWQLVVRITIASRGFFINKKKERKKKKEMLQDTKYDNVVPI